MYDVPGPVFRIGGVASIAAGVLMAAGFILHLAGENATFGADPMWSPAHASLWLVFVEIGHRHPSLLATLGDRDIISAAAPSRKRF
jgi:hypothetical protein